MQKEYEIRQGFISQRQHLVSGNDQRMTTMSTRSSLLFAGPGITTGRWHLVTWGLNLPLTVMDSSNINPFFTDVEDLLTAHLCSSMDSGLDVLVAS